MAALARACEQTEQEWALAQQAVHQAPSRIFQSPRTLSTNFPPYPATLCVYTDTDCSRHPHAYNNGKIILLMSLLTYQGGLTMPTYMNAKGSINQFVNALANEGSNPQHGCQWPHTQLCQHLHEHCPLCHPIHSLYPTGC